MWAGNDGCLYEVRSDPNEHHELSGGDPLCGGSCGKIKSFLMERIEELKQSAFTPVRCQGCDDGFGNIACTNPACAHPKACEMAMGPFGGFCASTLIPIAFLARDNHSAAGLQGGPFIDVDVVGV